MKNILFTLCILLLVGTSCQESFLDLAPKSTISPANFFKTSGDAVTAVNGCYKSLAVGGQYGSTFQVLMENRGDNFSDQDPSSGAGQNFQINRFSDNPGNTNLYNSWIAIYSSIFRCNTVLESIDPIIMDNTLKNRIKGEASFIRALNYFNLVRLWGAVPLVTKTVDPVSARDLKRDAVSAVYAQIEADLKFAAANLPATYPAADLGRVTQGAAKGLLGKVYLYQKKYNDAKTILDEVINSKVFSLLPKVEDVFSATVKYHAEILFAVRFAKGIAGQDHGFWYANTQVIGVDTTIQKAYTEAGDQRKTLVDAVRPTGNGNIMPRKFLDQPVNNAAGNDFPILRFADVLLIQAEALNEIGYNASTAAGTAFAHLNAVRKRAGIKELTGTDLPTQESFRAEIYKQRRLELPFECDRWFDLVRRGTAIAEIAANKKITIQPFRLIYGIPQQEIDIMNNPSTFGQNPGY
ncbi:RagB/SusD family nutrient uptake outer membrane protein [Haliscomenobacter sp.]|uniref:RagB/SusD family nutrient uptake outer membrane protein n=1 Tax=Haliscomenobacter sp. TaxID=2717303 RepID=UPI003364D8E5